MSVLIEWMADLSFREIVAKLVSLAGSQRELARRSGLSQPHIGDLLRGKVPLFESAAALAKAYPEFADDIEDATGHPVTAFFVSNREAPRELPTPPGAKLIAGTAPPLPLGPPVSAHDQSGIGDLDPDATVDLHHEAYERGADYALEVAGDCLEPHISRGDLVLVKRSKTARNGDIVVAQVMEDGFRGELGDALTLKIWRTADPFTAGFYRADGTRVHSSSQARIVGKVVGHMRKKLPSFK